MGTKVADMYRTRNIFLATTTGHFGSINRYLRINIGHFRSAYENLPYFSKNPQVSNWKSVRFFFIRVILNVPCSQLWIVDKTYHVFTSSCLHPTTSRVNKYLSYRFRTWYGRFKGFDESISAIRTRPIETFHLKVNQKCFFRNPRGFIDNNPVKLYVRWFLSKNGSFSKNPDIKTPLVLGFSRV